MTRREPPPFDREDDRPPFGRSWGVLYVLVILNLAVLIVLFTLFTLVFS